MCEAGAVVVVVVVVVFIPESWKGTLEEWYLSALS